MLSDSTITAGRRREEVLLNMLSRRLRPYAWLCLVMSALGTAYAVLGLVMVAALSGAPNYALERAQRNAHIWEAAILSGLALLALAVIVLLQTRKTNLLTESSTPANDS